MAMLYPHRNTLLLALVCTIAVGGTVWYVHRQDPASFAAQTTDVVATQDTSIPDTSSDGSTSDWRDQFLSSERGNTPVSDKKSSPTEQLTLTDQTGRNFFTNYMYLRQGNLTNNSQAVQNAVNYTIAETASRAPVPKTYGTDAVKTYADDGVASLRSYGNAVALAFSRYAPRADAAETAAIAFDKGDMRLLSGIDPIISAYARTITALMDMPVPSSLARYHIDLINGLSSMKYTAEGLRGGDTDPMQALIGISAYGSARIALQSALTGITALFSAQGISFSANEPGIAFSNISSISP